MRTSSRPFDSSGAKGSVVVAWRPRLQDREIEIYLHFFVVNCFGCFIFKLKLITITISCHVHSQFIFARRSNLQKSCACKKSTTGRDLVLVMECVSGTDQHHAAARSKSYRSRDIAQRRVHVCSIDVAPSHDYSLSPRCQIALVIHVLEK